MVSPPSRRSHQPPQRPGRKISYAPGAPKFPRSHRESSHEFAESPQRVSSLHTSPAIIRSISELALLQEHRIFTHSRTTGEPRRAGSSTIATPDGFCFIRFRVCASNIYQDWVQKTLESKLLSFQQLRRKAQRQCNSFSFFLFSGSNIT